MASRKSSTNMQTKFAEEYIRTGCARCAAKYAGYSDRMIVTSSPHYFKDILKTKGVQREIKRLKWERIQACWRD